MPSGDRVKAPCQFVVPSSVSGWSLLTQTIADSVPGDLEVTGTSPPRNLRWERFHDELTS